MNTTSFGRFTTKERAEIYAKAVDRYADYVIGACRVFSQVAHKMNGKCYTVSFRRALDGALLERFGTVEVGENTVAQRVRIVIENSFHGDLFCNIIVKDTDAVIDGKTYHVADEVYASIFLDADIAFEGNRRIKADEFGHAARRIAISAAVVQAKWCDAIRFWDKYMVDLARIDALIERLAPKINPLFIRADARGLLKGEYVRLMCKKFE